MNLKKLFAGAGSVTGYIVGLLGLLIAIFSVNGGITVVIKYSWIIMFGVFLIFIVVFVIIVIRNADKTLKEGIKYPIHSCDKEGEEVSLYIRYSKVFRIGALVSIYIETDGISKKMGIGIVHNMDMEEEKYTEISVLEIYKSYEDEFEKAQQKNKMILKSMYIAPTVTKESVAGIV